MGRICGCFCILSGERSAGRWRRRGCVERDQKVCSISFDAAWGADNTQKILDVLADYGVKATFFVVGNWADQYPEQAKAIVDSGCELMNHSNAHDHYNSLTAE